VTAQSRPGGRPSQFEGHRFDQQAQLVVERLQLIAQHVAVVLQPHLGQARQVLGVDLFDLHLHRQQGQQVVAAIGLVDARHQRRLALALGGVGLAVGVQAAGQPAEDLAHRLAGLLLRLRQSRCGLAACTAGPLPGRAPPGRRRAVGRGGRRVGIVDALLQALGGALQQLLHRAGITLEQAVVANRLAHQAGGQVQLLALVIGMAAAGMPVVGGLDLGVFALLENAPGQDHQQVPELSALLAGQPLPGGRAGQEAVDPPHGVALQVEQLALQGQQPGGGPLLAAVLHGGPLRQIAPAGLDLPGQAVEIALRLAQRPCRCRHPHQRRAAGRRWPLGRRVGKQVGLQGPGRRGAAGGVGGFARHGASVAPQDRPRP
jgi:hypothetical protein